MRKFWAQMAVAFILFGGVARVDRAQVSGSIGGGGDEAQQRFTSSSGRFSVVLPGPVKQKTEPVNLTGGATATLYEFWTELDNGNVAYMVMYNDYPANYATGDPQATLAQTEKGAVGGKKLLTDKAISLNGIPGREFTASDSDFNYTTCQYLQGTRLFQLIVVSAKSSTARMTSQFLASFRIL